MKTVVLSLVVVAFIGAIYGLWQLQPKRQTQTVNSQKSQTTPQENQAFQPQDGTVQKIKTINFKGQMLPNSVVFIYSSDLQVSTKTDQNGSFQKDFTLSPGLNLINIVSIPADPTKESKKSFTLYFDSAAPGKDVAAGIIKTIFDNVITLTTLNGQKNIKTLDSTDTTLPKDITSNQSTSSAKDIRVGDYAIAIGDATDQETITAKKLIIIRDNKPQNNE